MTALVIDYRETELIRCLELRGVPHRTESLPVGDIWIGISFPVKQADGADRADGTDGTDEKEQVQGLVIERKRITDFEASFLDGRNRGGVFYPSVSSMALNLFIYWREHGPHLQDVLQRKQ